MAPGMLSRHYAPATDTFLCDDIRHEIPFYKEKKIGLLLFKNLITDIEVAHQQLLSESGDINEAAKNLYAAMHHLDQLDLDVILAERLPNSGLGKTINDKLQRATQKTSF
jgi:L-threonylcarbamoyladenylate synthase